MANRILKERLMREPQKIRVTLERNTMQNERNSPTPIAASVPPSLGQRERNRVELNQRDLIERIDEHLARGVTLKHRV